MIPTSIAGRQRWVAWLVGLFLGMAGGVALLFAGPIGIAIVAVGIIWLAWQGPRLQSIAGFLLGFGAVWTVSFAFVKSTCNTVYALPGETCTTGNTDLWLLGSVAILAAGIVASYRGLQNRGRSAQLSRR